MDFKKNQYFLLLKQWCDALIDLQIKDSPNPAFCGGILCPCCTGMHGRIGDIMYPMVYLYSCTNDIKYYESARLAYDWVTSNMKRPGGILINDANSTWFGVTAFFNIQLGELLYQLKDSIHKRDYQKWMATYLETTDFIYNKMTNNLSWNINYPVAVAPAMAIAYKITGDKKYEVKARAFAKETLSYICEDGLLAGEGTPNNIITDRGFRPVDLGYNVEESLPSLVLYLTYIGEDQEVEREVIRSMAAHLSFMLPDGGWDNTWGIRTAKWTYWGSRTSDGCQIAYAGMADKNDAFFEAAHRNFELYKKCTINGLLAGGIHHDDAQEPVCVHHSFCHIKGILPMITLGRERKRGIKLPIEEADGIRHFSSANVTQLARGEFRATVACSDYRFPPAPDSIPTGGAVTMLYHNLAGMILAGGQNEFRLLEPQNMQVPKYFENICQLARIELINDKKKFTNTYDTLADIICTDENEIICCTADGILKNVDLNGKYRYKMIYTMAQDAFIIQAKTEADGASYILPVIAKSSEPVTIHKNKATVQKKNCVIHIECSQLIFHDTARGDRIFNTCGGINTAHLYTKMKKNSEVSFQITVAATS